MNTGMMIGAVILISVVCLCLAVVIVALAVGAVLSWRTREWEMAALCSIFFVFITGFVTFAASWIWQAHQADQAMTTPTLPVHDNDNHGGDGGGANDDHD